ncbi:MAG: Crp/Fnr family transcriptional regulator [Paenibacillaceae bacterium]|jgi:CRP-like cAMP-binding protein|nr:Crp/Fnr family transcriptional regulator [Paenibacillaceae bacterium]
MEPALHLCPLFRHLQPDAAEALLGGLSCQVVHFRNKQLIYDELRFRQELGIVLEGKVEVLKILDSGKKVILNTLAPGGIFGVSAVFSDEREFVTTLQARSNARVLFLGEALLLELFERDKQVLIHYLQFVNRRIRFLNRRVECFAHEQIALRLMVFLRQLQEEQNGSECVHLPFSRTQLADYLGVSRGSLYRTLKNLEKNRTLQLKGEIAYFNP